MYMEICGSFWHKIDPWRRNSPWNEKTNLFLSPLRKNARHVRNLLDPGGGGNGGERGVRGRGKTVGWGRRGDRHNPEQKEKFHSGHFSLSKSRVAIIRICMWEENVSNFTSDLVLFMRSASNCIQGSTGTSESLIILRRTIASTLANKITRSHGWTNGIRGHSPREDVGNDSSGNFCRRRQYAFLYKIFSSFLSAFFRVHGTFPSTDSS